MKKRILSFAKKFDELISRTHLSMIGEKSSLITFLFHGLFKNEKEIELNFADPQQAITTSIFRRFVEYYQKNDYIFISPQDILNGLETGKKYVLITFDDGYYNNHLALPILREFQVPAVFFISSNHIIQNKCFWWDVIYRERLKQGADRPKVQLEVNGQKHKKNSDIELYLLENFGENALRPVSDIDRPFTPLELKEFSKESFVFLGNHTSNHAILTNYSAPEIKSEIQNAQRQIFNVTEIEPVMISYPNGNFSPDVIRASRECNIKLGITVNSLKNFLPINMDGDDAFRLNRFTLWGDQNVDGQCSLIRSDFQLLKSITGFFRGKRNENSMSY